MDENEILLSCFKSLNERFHQIRNNTCSWVYQSQKSTIDEISKNGIYGCKPENVIDVIYETFSYIESIKNDIDLILENKVIKPVIEVCNEFPFIETVKLTSLQVKEKLKFDLLKELEFYSQQLNDLMDLMETRLVREKSNRLLNSVDKIRWNLTVDEIGSLFRLLNKSGYITNMKNEEIRHVDLAKFLSKTFMSKGRNGELSVKNLKNSLNPEKSIDIDIKTIFPKLFKSK